MVITLAFASLYYSARGSRDALMTTNRDFELMRVYAQMRQQLVNFYISPDQDLSLQGEKGIEEKHDSIEFYTSSPVQGKGVVDAYYAIKTGDEKDYLAYREFPFTKKIEMIEPTAMEDAIGIRWMKVSDRINGMKLSYYQGDQEFKEWKDNEPPERIVTELFYTVGKEVESFSFSVAPGIEQKAGISSSLYDTGQ